MKTTIVALVCFTAFRCASAQNAIDIGEFKKISESDGRMKLIQQAPLSQQNELKSIDLHLRLLSHYKTEENLNMLRKRQTIKDRGFSSLQRLFSEHWNLWQIYRSQVVEDSRMRGESAEKQVEVERETRNKAESYAKTQMNDSRVILLGLAATPEAFTLEQRAEALLKRMFRMTTTSAETPASKVTLEEREAVDREVDEIFREIKSLPKLSSREIQREVGSISDSKLLKE